MQNEGLIDRKIAVVQLIRKSMRLIGLALNRQLSVAVLVGRASPQPTTVRLLNVLPKSLGGGFCPANIAASVGAINPLIILDLSIRAFEWLSASATDSVNGWGCHGPIITQ